MITVTIGLEMRGVHDVVDNTGLTAALKRVTLSVERAVLGITPGLEHGLAILSEDRNHAARGVAVKRREGAAQHLDVIGRTQIKLRELALTVRHCAGNAIRVEAHAAHAEAGARTEAPHRELQILGVILAALDRNARDLDQRLRQVDLQLALVDPSSAYGVHRHRKVKA